MKIDRSLQNKLIEEILQQEPAADRMSAEELKGLIALVVNRFSSRYSLSFSQRRKLITDIFNSMRGLDVLQRLVDDPEITEVMVNGPDFVFYEKEGRSRLSASLCKHS